MEVDGVDPDAAGSRRRLRRDQYSLRRMLELIAALSTILSLSRWVPGLGAVLLLMLGWLILPAAVLALLIFVQWPLMLLTMHLSDASRKRQRDERQALRYLVVPEKRIGVAFQSRSVSE